MRSARLGDAFLSRDGEKAFLGGLASFLVAHIVYIALFLRSGGGLGLLGAESWRGAIALAPAVFVVVMLAALWRRVGPSLRIPIAVCVSQPVDDGHGGADSYSAWVIGGAVLFMASDGLLATEKFLVVAISPHRAWMRFAVWVLYYAAQVAITLGFLLG